MNGGPERHILMTADAVGGVWQYALELAASLRAGGDRATLAVLGPNLSDRQRDEAARIAGLEVVETGEALDWLADGPATAEQAARAVAALARETRADLVHCNSPALLGAAEFPCPAAAAAHGCLATWWQAVRGEPPASFFEWHRALMRRGLLAADMVIAPSAAFAEDVREVYELPAAPLVVHNARRLPADIGAGKPRLDGALTVGRLWDEAKGADVLDRAAGMIDATLLAAGAAQGPQGQRFTPAHLELLGSLDEAALAALLARQPVFVSAARFEPFGLAVLEAAQAGCALVLADIATFRELWEGAALFVSTEDAAGFAHAIEALLADSARRRTLGEAAARQAGRYSPEVHAKAMSALYDRVLEQPRAAA